MERPRGVVVISGATSDIGRAIALSCALQGSTCVVLGRSLTTLGSLVDVLPGHGHRAIVVDLTAADVQTRLIDAMSGLTISGLVHAAGLHAFAPVAMERSVSREVMFRVNVGAFLDLVGICVRRRLFSSDGASVIGLSSVAAHRGQAALASYGASRAATVSAARALARELAPKRIRVNTLSLGWVDTVSARAITARLTEAQRTDAIGAYPLGLGTPEDVAQTVLYLLGDQSRWMTGVDLVLDGGFLA